MRLDLAKVILKNVTFMAKYSQETLNRIYRLGKPIWKLMGLDDDAWNKLDAAFKQGDYTPEATRERQRQVSIELNSGDDILAAIGNPDLYNYESDDDAAKQQTVDFINRLQMLDQRQYDAKLTKEARQYDSPQSQLARLMATGLSRDAALAMISGGTGVGVQNTAQPVQMDNSIMPSQTQLNKVEAITQPINTAMNVFQTVASLAQFGISLPSMLSQNSISAGNAYLQKKSLSAFDAVSSIGSFVGDAVRTGQLTDEDWQDTDAFLGKMSSLYGNDSAFNSAVTEFYSNPFARQQLNSLVDSRWQSHQLRPTDELLTVQRENLFALQKLNKYKADQTFEQTEALKKEMAALYEDGGLMDKRSQMYDAQIELTKQQTKNAEQQEKVIIADVFKTYEETSNIIANTDYVRSRTEAQENENIIRSATAKAYELKFDEITQGHIDELSNWAAMMAQCNSEELRQATFEAMLADQKSIRTLATLNCYRAQCDVDLIDRFPTWFSVAEAFDLFRVPEMIRTVDDHMTKKDARFMMLTKSVGNMLPMLKGSYGAASAGLTKAFGSPTGMQLGL